MNIPIGQRDVVVVVNSGQTVFAPIRVIAIGVILVGMGAAAFLARLGRDAVGPNPRRQGRHPDPDRDRQCRPLGVQTRLARQLSDCAMERDPVRVIGLGFRAAADLASLQDALQRALAEAGNPKIDALVTEAAKSREKVFRELAQLMHVPGLGVTRADLEQMITPTQSQRIQDRFGTGSLAEAAALASAGPQARLLGPRVQTQDGMATAAIAEGSLT